MKYKKEIMGLFLFPLALVGIRLISRYLPSNLAWFRGFSTQISILIIASLMLVFIKPRKEKFKLRIKFQFKDMKKYLLITFIYGFFSIFIMGIISQTLVNNPGNHPVMKSSTLMIILKIFILASFSEELFFRGAVINWFENWSEIRFMKISLPILFGALFFSFAHCGLLRSMDRYLVYFIFLSTFIVGILAGKARMRTRSIIPAYIIHFSFNLMGTGIPMILSSFIK